MIYDATISPSVTVYFDATRTPPKRRTPRGQHLLNRYALACDFIKKGQAVMAYRLEQLTIKLVIDYTTGSN